MAGADGPDRVTLKALLANEPYRFEFRQAVRLLEIQADHEARGQTRSRRASVPLGAGIDPRREAVRLSSSLTSSFPPSDVESLVPGDDAERPTLTVTFLGIGGAFGPLPTPLTTRIVERKRMGDNASLDFLDIFNHRLLSLLLRQFRLFHPALHVSPNVDAPARLPLLALLGLATLPRDGSSASMEGRLGDLTTTLVGAAGLLNQRPVSAHALERLLQGHFGLPIKVVPLRGGWLRLDDEDRVRLGRLGRLGDDAILGGRIWDAAAGILIDVAVSNVAAIRSFLPGRVAHSQMARLIRFALGEQLDVTLRLSVDAQQIPRRAQLPAAAFVPPSEAQLGPRLGWTAWLGRPLGGKAAVVSLRLAGRR